MNTVKKVTVIIIGLIQTLIGVPMVVGFVLTWGLQDVKESLIESIT